MWTNPSPYPLTANFLPHSPALLPIQPYPPQNYPDSLLVPPPYLEYPTSNPAPSGLKRKASTKTTRPAKRAATAPINFTPQDPLQASVITPLVVQNPETAIVPKLSYSPPPQHPEKEVADDEDGVYVDITQYLNLPQGVAAKKLNIPTSTLSKRWTDAVKKRKWPYRALCKLDKEITTLLMNIPRDGTEGNPDSLPPEIQKKLAKLMCQRQEYLKPVLIRLKQPPPRNESDPELTHETK